MLQVSSAAITRTRRAVPTITFHYWTILSHCIKVEQRVALDGTHLALDGNQIPQKRPFDSHTIRITREGFLN